MKNHALCLAVLFRCAYVMTAAELRECVNAYDTILATWTAESEAHRREADKLQRDITELTKYRDALAEDVASRWRREARRKHV